MSSLYIRVMTENRFYIENPFVEIPSTVPRFVRLAIHKIRRRERLAADRKLGTHTESEWIQLVCESGGQCVRCMNLCVSLEKDHIIPIYKGGSEAISNLQPLCKKCNRSKGSETINWVLLRRQKNG